MITLIDKTFPVLDKGSVTLLDMMPHPSTGVSGDLAIVSAARVSFLGESKGEEKDKRLLFYLMRHQHTSPFEQVEFKFRLYAPMVTLWQLVRHRTAHLNLSSGRYVAFEEDQFYTPTVWRRQSASNKQASDGTLSEDRSALWTQRFVQHWQTSYALYEDALYEGIAKEQARLFLPGWASYYACVFKIDAHNLMHFLKLRMAPDAQFEIRAYADVIYHQIFKPALPWTAEAFETFVMKGEA